MNKNSLFTSKYNKANMINIKSDLDIYDECSFSYLDILKEKEVEVYSKSYVDCKCVESVNFTTYYDKCDKCNGKGKITFNEVEVVCNKCHGDKRVIKEKCPKCKGEGKVIKKDKVLVKLNKELKDNDIITIKGKGKVSNEVMGDLYIKVSIKDRDYFVIKGNDVYDKRIIEFSKEDILKKVSKSVETIKGSVRVTSNGEKEYEVIRLENGGMNEGDFYVCLHNELVPIKGNDVYKNILVEKDNYNFYLSREEINSEEKWVNAYYFKRINDYKEYEYITIEDVNNFKIVKLKEKGESGKNGGSQGDLYLRVYFKDEFFKYNNELYYKPLKLSRYEVSEGKKIIELNKEKIILNFTKNINEEEVIGVNNSGLMISKNNFAKLYFTINPFEYDIYKVSVRVNKKDKVIYLKDYKKYFYEEVRVNYSDGLKVILSKNKDNVVYDTEGNKVIIRVIR